MYKANTALDQPASFATFRYSWQQFWRKYLRIQKRVNIGKCMVCEKLKEMRRRASLPEQIEEATNAHKKHVEDMMSDRRTDTRVQLIARESCCGPFPKEWSQTVLNFDVDWMDQAKFKCPRNTTMAKQFADAWHPNWRPAESLWMALVHSST